MSKPTPFDAYEIHPVVLHQAPDGSRFAEQTADPAEASCWSLFGHIPGQGLECVGDFPTYELAAEIYARITGHGYGEEAPEGAERAVRRDADLRLRLAAPELLEALNDKELDQAHDALSNLLEDPDAANDDIRDAAITLCAALCDFSEKRHKTITKATEAAE